MSTRTGRFISLTSVVLALLASCGEDGGSSDDIGASCQTDRDCAEGLECTDGVCSMAASTDRDASDARSDGNASDADGSSGGSTGSDSGGTGSGATGSGAAGMGGAAGASNTGTGGTTGSGGATGAAGMGGSAGSGTMPPDPHILPDGLQIPLTGGCSVSWYNATQLGGGSCSFTLVPTLSGTASPLDATLEINDELDGSKTAIFDSTTFVSGSSLAIGFPGANGNPWQDAELPLTLQEDSWRTSLLYEGTCGGHCCGELLPHRIRYTLDIDVVTRDVTLSISGALPNGPHPNPDLCWCNQANLSCSYSGEVP